MNNIFKDDFTKIIRNFNRSNNEEVKEASAYSFVTSYGQQPSCSEFVTSTTIRDITDNSNTPVDSNADYYYINANIIFYCLSFTGSYKIY